MAADRLLAVIQLPVILKATVIFITHKFNFFIPRKEEKNVHDELLKNYVFKSVNYLLQKFVIRYIDRYNKKFSFITTTNV